MTDLPGPERRRFQYSLGTLFLFVTLVAVVVSLTSEWHKYVLAGYRPALESEIEWEEEWLREGRDSLHYRYTPGFVAFFLASSLGVWFAIKRRECMDDVVFGLSLAWPLTFVIISLFSCVGSLVVGLVSVALCLGRRRFVRSACLAGYHTAWLAFGFHYFMDWFTVFYD